MAIVKDLGMVTAYAYAVAGGYEGTEAEFEEMLGQAGITLEQLENLTAVATTLTEGSEATASYSDGVLTFGIPRGNTGATGPQGPQGVKGDTGNGIVSITKTGTSGLVDTYTITFTNGTTTTFTVTNGADGDITNVAAAFDATKAYSVGDMVLYQGTLYAFTAAHPAGAWVGSDTQAVILADEVTSLKSDLKQKADQTDMLKAFPTDTASGAVASFADGANVPVKSLIIDINPVQSGSGVPSPDNVRPISGWSEVNVNACGVNVWDEEWEVGGISSADGSKYNDNFRIRSKNYISVKPSTQYYFAMPAALNQFKVVFYKQDKTFLSYRSYNNTVFTTPSDCYWLMISENATDYGTTYNHDISINYPSTDHDYHPGTVASVEVQLGQTVYGGTLDVLSGELVIDMAMVDLGTLTWTYMSSSSVFRCSASPAQNPNVICSQYATNNPYIPWSQMEDGTIEAGAMDLIVKDTRYTDAATFKTAMSGVQLCYELATPITVTLTPNELSTLLGANNIWSDAGEVTAEYRADPTLFIQRKIAEALS